MRRINRALEKDSNKKSGYAGNAGLYLSLESWPARTAPTAIPTAVVGTEIPLLHRLNGEFAWRME